ncbi:MAG: polymer-forming cytoskeletal protein [Candidatus Glassbacteria bacterium]|nr:polymer-forming cytoskeletal protein [Candidatus Glassbacteria bacterium]
MVEKMTSPKEERLNTIIGQGTVLKGECSVNGTVRVDGVIDGSLAASGVAILGKSGRIKGDLLVQNAVVGGKVEGSVIAQGRLELQTGASVKGDITARKLIVEEGVYFDGSCNMEKEALLSQPKQDLPPAAEKRVEPGSEKANKIRIEEGGVGGKDDDLTFRGEKL